MCSSIVFNGKKTIIGFNFDNPCWTYRIEANKDVFHVSLFVNNSFWEPIFGVNSNGDFINLPMVNPVIEKGKFVDIPNALYIDRINIALLERKITFNQLVELVKNNPVYNEIDNSLQAQDSDKFGNVLQIIPGLGYKYLKKPHYSVMTNFQTLEEEKEHHPYAGVDRYEMANKLLSSASDEFDVDECFQVLSKISQDNPYCPTQVSIVYDATDNIVYWCENRNWNEIKYNKF